MLMQVKKLHIEEESSQNSKEKASLLYKTMLLFSYPYVIPVILAILCQTITMAA
jgi:hypothetical protein